MKKIKNIILLLTMLFIVLSCLSNVKAVVEYTPEIPQIEIVSPTSGSYTTGQTITFAAIFSTDMTDILKTSKLTIKFSESNTTREITMGMLDATTVTYTYTITAQDKGTLSLESYEYNWYIDEENNGTSKIQDDVYVGDVVIKANESSQSGDPQPGNPQSATWADGNSAEITIGSDYYMSVGNLPQNNEYYIFIANGNNPPTVPETGFITGRSIKGDGSQVDKVSVEKYLEKNGDIYVWIYQSQVIREGDTATRTNKCILSAKKVERPAQKKLGSRMKCYFFSDYTSSFLYEPRDHELARKINIKIGKVTDNSILRSIKNGEANCLNNLLEYSKKQTPIYTTTINLSSSSVEPTITSNFDVIDGEYYYVYMELDDENGTYYPVEDISLYQGLVSDTIGKNLFDYLDSSFKWNLSEEDTPKKDDDTVTPDPKLPDTGVNVIIGSILIVSVVAVVILGVKYKKYNIKF